MGHQKTVQQLERARKADRVAHAYLFHGPDGVGKRMVALAFAQALNCTAGDGAPCGTCEACMKISRYNHPDVRIVASEEYLVNAGLLDWDKGNPSNQIKNEQLEELSGLFRHKPYMGGVKVVVVVDAHLMNAFAQNRFLKTLEEPSDDTVIIMITAYPQSLLSTIRSRCQALSFAPLPRKLITDFLVARGQEESRAQVLAAMAQGSMKRALQMSDESVLDGRDEYLAMIGRAVDGDLADVIKAGQELGRGSGARQRLEQVLDTMELWIRDVLYFRAGLGRQYMVNADILEKITGCWAKAQASELVTWLDRVRNTRKSMRFNVNPGMALEHLLLQMKGL